MPHSTRESRSWTPATCTGWGTTSCCSTRRCGAGAREGFVSVKFGALALDLSAGDLAEIERAVPPGSAAGDRYDAHSMKLLDSERDA